MMELLSSMLHVGTDTLASALILLGKATVLLAVALGITLIMQRTSAVSRHLVWLSALAAVLIIPLVIALSPVRMAILPSTWGVPSTTIARDQVRIANDPGVRSAAQAVASESQQRVDGAESQSQLQLQSQLQSQAEVIPGSAQNSNVLPVDPAGQLDDSRLSRSTMFTTPSIGVLLVSAWALIAIGFTSWLLLGMWSVRRIVRHATVLDGERWTTLLYEIADRLSLNESPRLVVSDNIAMPFACGLRTPTIVLPRNSDAWTPEQRTAVLLHEMAHIKRRDIVGHTVGRFACALYWFHPLVWTAAKKLRAESERACDDMALMCGARASDYAEHLLDIVARVKSNTTPPMAMAMATRKEFEGRMLAILDPALHRVGPSRGQSASLVSAVVVLALCIGMAAPATSEAVQRSAIPTTANTTEHAPLAAPMEPNAPVSGLRAIARIDSTRSDAMRTEEAAKAMALSFVNVGLGAFAQALGDLKLDPTHGILTAKDSSERPALLAKILTSEGDPELRRVSAWGLCAFAKEPVAAEALVLALRRDTSAAVREMSAWALESTRRQTAANAALVSAIRNDNNALVRLTAVWSLASTGDRSDSATVRAFAFALKDTDARTREMAAWALGSISLRKAPAELIAATQDSDSDVRMSAAWALYTIGDASSVNVIDKALRNEKVKEVQLAQVRALTSLGEPAIDVIKRLLDDPDAEIKTMAVNALAGSRGGGPWPRPRPRPRPFP